LSNYFDHLLRSLRSRLMLLLRQVGEKFRNRSLKFPGLISGCTMDWFQRWPKDALIAVSSHFLSQYHIVSEDETKKQLIEMMGTVHDGVAENCITYFQRSVSTSTSAAV